MKGDRVAPAVTRGPEYGVHRVCAGVVVRPRRVCPDCGCVAARIDGQLRRAPINGQSLAEGNRSLPGPAGRSDRGSQDATAHADRVHPQSGCVAFRVERQIHVAVERPRSDHRWLAPRSTGRLKRHLDLFQIAPDRGRVAAVIEHHLRRRATGPALFRDRGSATPVENNRPLPAAAGQPRRRPDQLPAGRDVGVPPRNDRSAVRVNRNGNRRSAFGSTATQ